MMRGYYMLNQWSSLKNFIEAGLVEISNDLCEQRMKPIKLNMKNCQNIGSEKAAERANFIFSETESCELNGINPTECRGLKIMFTEIHSMNILKKLWNKRSVLRYIHKTIYFNFRCLPFEQALKLPIWLYRPDIVSCKGEVIITGGVKTGMIRLGFNKVSIYPKTGIMIENRGSMVFHGRCEIGNDSYVSIGKYSTVEFGDNFTATASFRLASLAGITFDKRVSVGWNCLFIDSDFHRLTRDDGIPVKPLGKIHIGSNVWVGNNCIIMKNTQIPDYTTIAAGTMVGKDVNVPERAIIGNARTVTVLKTGIWRDFTNDQIIYDTTE